MKKNILQETFEKHVRLMKERFNLKEQDEEQDEIINTTEFRNEKGKKYIVTVFQNRTEYRNETGKLDREDGPAVEYTSGSKQWWVNGKLHREDGPAVEHIDGSKSWFVDGERHRLDGPAIEWPGRRKEWWIKGKQYTEAQFNEKVKQVV